MRLRLGPLVYLCVTLLCATSGSVPSAVVAFRWAEEAYRAELHALEAYYLQQAADQGHAPAQFLLATYLEKGRGTEPNLPQAMQYFRAAAEADIPQAIIRMGEVPGEIETLQHAAQLGDVESQYRLAQHYTQEGDTEKAWEWYRHAAEQGHRAACVEVAQQLYERGDASETALAFLEVSACKGEPFAQWALGEAYRSGIGGYEKDLTLAVMWYRRAANLGYKDAMLRLAQCYRYGEGVAKDAQLAAYWQAQAAEE